MINAPNSQNSQFDSIASFESVITRLFYRALLQKWIFIEFPEELQCQISFTLDRIPSNSPSEVSLFTFKRLRLLIMWRNTTIRSILKYHFPKKVRCASKFPQIEKLKAFYDRHQSEFILFSGYFVLQCLYPFHNHVHSLIGTIGQLLESAIIADRVYYLQRHGASVQVHCAFDRRQSPRCMCITARKWHVSLENREIHLFS